MAWLSGTHAARVAIKPGHAETSFRQPSGAANDERSGEHALPYHIQPTDAGLDVCKFTFLFLLARLADLHGTEFWLVRYKQIPSVSILI